MPSLQWPRPSNRLQTELAVVFGHMRKKKTEDPSKYAEKLHWYPWYPGYLLYVPYLFYIALLFGLNLTSRHCNLTKWFRFGYLITEMWVPLALNAPVGFCILAKRGRHNQLPSVIVERKADNNFLARWPTRKNIAHLKDISQIGSFPQVGVKIKKSFETTT